MLQACIFDLDGTLINSLKDLAVSVNYALSRQGFPIHEEEAYRYYVGQGVDRLVEAVLPENHRDQQTLALTKALFNEYYGAHCLDYTRPYEGIPPLLDGLKARGLRLAVASNKPDCFVKDLVGRLFKDRFEAVMGNRDGMPHKPDPAVVSGLCRALDVPPAACIFVGDSGVDMLTAKNAGMLAVGATWGFRTREELKANGADCLIDSPDQLLSLIA